MKIEQPSGRLTAAMEYARTAHGAQRRKGTKIPYLAHVMAVSALIFEYGGDEDQAVAGFLHDVLEDCGPHHEPVIRERFGERVADMVLACTEKTSNTAGEKAEWHERKAGYLDQLRTAGADALLVSAADKLHNTRAILADLRAGHDVFNRFKGGNEGTIWYYAALVDAFSDRMSSNHPIIIELAATLAAIRLRDRAGSEARAAKPPASSVILQ